RGLLERYGFRFPVEGVARTTDEALAAARRIGFPVVVKTAAAGLLHKTEAGGVILDVPDEPALRAACRALGDRFGPAPVLVQARIPDGLELLIGGRRDATFGPTVAVGLGGVLAELLRDVSLRLAPLDQAEALTMLREGRKAELLRGYRGGPAADADRLAALPIAVGDLLLDHPQIAELDVNPVVVRGADLAAVDALVVIDHQSQGGSPHA
ncbi:MAG: acetate--CoA ligase family protein, partial [Candidatus Rokuibacteriota bacterium]